MGHVVLNRRYAVVLAGKSVLGLTSLCQHVDFIMEVSDMEQLVETKVKEVLAGNNNELLKSIGSMIDKISSNSSGQSINASAEKPTFKRKSNEEQFKHNSKVMMKLEEATCHITTENIEKARESIIEGN